MFEALEWMKRMIYSKAKGGGSVQIKLIQDETLDEIDVLIKYPEMTNEVIRIEKLMNYQERHLSG